MPYCEYTDVQSILAQSVTSSSAPTAGQGGNVPGNLTQIGNQLALNVIPQADINYYIRLADAHIDAALSQQYATPLIEACDVEQQLVMDVNEYNDIIQLTQAAVLSPGDKLLFFDGTNQERHYVVSIDADFTTVTLDSSLFNNYSASNTRVLRVKFTDPIPFISAKLAASAVYNKYFMAQADPNKSEYGDMVRKEAIQELNNIREGRTILHGVQRIGWRFANPNLIDRYSVKGAFDSDNSRSDQQQ